MKKRCFSCGVSFELSGSGKRQKYCSKTCRNNGNGGLYVVGTEGGSNPLKTKVAKSDLSPPIPPRSYEPETVREQIERKSCHPSPIGFRTPEGAWGRVWLGVGARCIGGKWEGGNEQIIGDDRHWRVNAATPSRKKKEASPPENEASPPPRGFKLQLLLQDEAPAIRSGQRLVVCQFRGKNVVLHHAGYAATIKREAFKELVASNKRYRKRNQAKPSLRLVVSNPRTVARLPNQEAAA